MERNWYCFRCTDWQAEGHDPIVRFLAPWHAFAKNFGYRGRFIGGFEVLRSSDDKHMNPPETQGAALPLQVSP